MRDIFTEKNISPMLIGSTSEPFDNPDYLYEIKWDGERCLAYLDPRTGTELRNKRNERMLIKVPELSEIHRQAKVRCILDGELLIMKNGRPDFEAIQRRSLMSNRFRIELDGKQNPASFLCFDILYYKDREFLSLPLTERKALLDKAFSQSPRLAQSRVYPAQGTTLFQLAKEQGLEGIVAKKKESIYIPGKRTASWVKMKVLMDDDFVICGYILKSNHVTSLVLGQYRGTTLVYRGHVTLGVSGSTFSLISSQPTLDHPPFSVFPTGHGNEEAVWLEPVLVCTVKFMYYNEKGGMRQPVFKGLRKDKTPRECQDTLW